MPIGFFSSATLVNPSPVYPRAAQLPARAAPDRALGWWSRKRTVPLTNDRRVCATGLSQQDDRQDLPVWRATDGLLVHELLGLQASATLRSA